jgi:hypothetical protein
MLRAPSRPAATLPTVEAQPRLAADVLADPEVGRAAVEDAPSPATDVELALRMRAEIAAVDQTMPSPVAPPASPAMAAGAPMAVRSWQPARQGSRDRAPVREPVGLDPNAEPAAPGIERVATAPQLRRFIKSRAYVPMHELRRRFAINGGDDDVTPIELDRNRVYVGLPEREGRLLGELLRGGDIGYELSLDPISPIVVGVYPMRPVTRG